MTIENQLVRKWTELENAFVRAFRGFNKQDIPAFLRKHRVKGVDGHLLNAIRNVRNAIAHPEYLKNGNPLVVLNDNIIHKLDDIIATVNTLPKVGNVMRVLQDVDTCSPDSEIMALISKMIMKAYSNIPVLNDKGRVLGVFSESTMLKVGLDMLRSRPLRRISDIMGLVRIAKNNRRPDRFFFVGKDDPVVSLQHMCHEAVADGKRSELFLVTDNGRGNGKLMGIVTVWDFVGLIEINSDAIEVPSV